MSTNMDDRRGQVIEQTDSTNRSEVASQSSLHGPASEPPDFGSRPSNNLRQSVALHIEELVLSGFEPAHRYAIGDALERELTRLFSEQDSPIAATEDVEVAHVNYGSINLSLGSDPEATGIQLARAIYGGLSK